MKGTINLVKDAVHKHFNDQQGCKRICGPTKFVIGPSLVSFQEGGLTFDLLYW